MLPAPRQNKERAWRFRMEAIAALIIIATVTAIAMPLLEAPREAARGARLKSAFALLQSTSRAFHAYCLASSSPTDEGCNRMTLNGVAVAGAHGWPAASTEGIATALKLAGPMADIEWQSEKVEGVPAMRARLKPVAVAGTCEFIYAQAASPGAAPRMELIDATCP